MLFASAAALALTGHTREDVFTPSRRASPRPPGAETLRVPSPQRGSPSTACSSTCLDAKTTFGRQPLQVQSPAMLREARRRPCARERRISGDRRPSTAPAPTASRSAARARRRAPALGRAAPPTDAAEAAIRGLGDWEPSTRRAREPRRRREAAAGGGGGSLTRGLDAARIGRLLMDNLNVGLAPRPPPPAAGGCRSSTPPATRARSRLRAIGCRARAAPAPLPATRRTRRPTRTARGRSAPCRAPASARRRRRRSGSPPAPCGARGTSL